MNIFVLPEGLQQTLILGKMRQHPQIDLRIVTGYQYGAGRGNKSLADFPSQLAPAPGYSVNSVRWKKAGRWWCGSG